MAPTAGALRSFVLYQPDLVVVVGARFVRVLVLFVCSFDRGEFSSATNCLCELHWLTVKLTNWNNRSSYRRIARDRLLMMMRLLLLLLCVRCLCTIAAALVWPRNWLIYEEFARKRRRRYARRERNSRQAAAAANEANVKVEPVSQSVGRLKRMSTSDEQEHAPRRRMLFIIYKQTARQILSHPRSVCCCIYIYSSG